MNTKQLNRNLNKNNIKATYWFPLFSFSFKCADCCSVDHGIKYSLDHEIHCEH